jgi:hypothetical protein
MGKMGFIHLLERTAAFGIRLLLLCCVLAGLENAVHANELKVFDATLYSHKPDLSKYGIKPLRVVYSQEIWIPGEDWGPLPSDRKVKTVANRIARESSIVALDVEHWPVSPSDGDVDSNLSKLQTLLKWYKASSPGVQVGYYGILPIRDYWRINDPRRQPEIKNWQSENTKLLHLGESVDVLFPSLYTFYPDREGWVKYAKANIAEARRIGNGKPVYVFLWPQYHDSNQLIGEQYIESEYWRLEMETAREFADGMVIWGGWNLKHNGRLQWDENAPWWVVTKAFLRENGLTPNLKAPQILP